MKAYVVTTGVVFGLIALAHVWRMIQERWRPAHDPFFVVLTLVAAALAIWAWRVARAPGSPRTVA